jgi:cytochrome c biogenesis protein CcmG/thiol:disulfide interchange protein DsbE
MARARVAGVAGSLLQGAGWLAVVVLLLVFVAVASRVDVAANTEQPDLVAPAMVAAALSSSEQPVAFAEYHGRPVVLHFWASWHADAREQVTILERVSQDYTIRDQGVAILGVAAFDGLRPVKDLVRGLVLTYPNGLDADGDIARRYGVTSVPTTLFIDRDGRVVRQRAGTLSEADLRRAIADIVP